MVDGDDMNESRFLTEEQEKNIRSYGYSPTLIGENLEVWKVIGDDLMIDIGKENDVVWCKIWISENDVKTFSPKRIKSFLKKYFTR